MSGAGAGARPLRLGTRRSPLAMFQANAARDALLAAYPDLEVEIIGLVSDGDRDTRQLQDIAERGIFAHVLERALRADEIDAAVHSSKDLEMEPADGLVLAAWLPREDARDALVGAPGGTRLVDLPHGALVATGSARRMAGLRTVRADLVPNPIRGNVATRIALASERGDAGCMLAMAGLTRLGLVAERDDITPIDVDDVVPEAGQGAVVIQARSHVDSRYGVDWSRIDDPATRRAAELERELARRLGGGCARPVGLHVELAESLVHAFAAPSPDAVGTRIRLELVGLELAPLLSVASATDIGDAVSWVADRLTPVLAEQLGIDASQVTP
ncbi:MAG: Porphobilinogen deaminase [Thermoleophilia bacterium]|jgi:hydroxymethylbilane synthase|nr:Porphobilinogen deaminase [Thermoleophilia bacterium]